MSITVDIIIKGISICYRKEGLWKILFPIDDEDCHKIDFIVKKEDGKEEAKGKLADKKSIVISASGAESETGESSNFTACVYDLTSAKTHGKIRMKPDAGKYVLMTIPNAFFSVDKYLEVIAPDHKIPDLVEVGNSANWKPITTLAHSAKAIIRLENTGRVTVKADDYEFETDAGSSYTLTFDNDCEEIIDGKNDMDMFYQIIEEFDPQTGTKIDRQFRIGEVGKAPVIPAKELLENFSEKFFEKFTVFPKDPPDFLQGKTCLFGKVSDEESIENLP